MPEILQRKEKNDMGKTRYKWWMYVKAIIRDYPRLKEERAALQEMNITAGFSPRIGSSEVSRGTENYALRILPGVSEKEFQAVEKAISETAKDKYGPERLALIEMVFWKQSHTLVGAAMAIPTSQRTGRRWHSDFIKLVAKHYGLLE